MAEECGVSVGGGAAGRHQIKPDRFVEPRESWRFANGFIDDALYYWEGQQRFEALMAAGKRQEAIEVAGAVDGIGYAQK